MFNKILFDNHILKKDDSYEIYILLDHQLIHQLLIEA
jgi:hypothetical protein